MLWELSLGYGMHSKLWALLHNLQVLLWSGPGPFRQNVPLYSALQTELLPACSTLLTIPCLPPGLPSATFPGLLNPVLLQRLIGGYISFQENMLPPPNRGSFTEFSPLSYMLLS